MEPENAPFQASLLNVPILWETFRIEQAGLVLEVTPRTEVAFRPCTEFSGKQVVTTDVRIADLSSDRLEAAKAVVQELAELLSLATSSEVRFGAWQHTCSRTRGEILPKIGVFRSGRPLVDPDEPEAISRFLSAAWPSYAATRRTRSLNVALEYYLASQFLGPLELRLITTFVLFEHLKHSYALAAGYRQEAKGGLLSPPPASKRATFEALLTEMFSSVGMHPRLKEIKDLRNQLIHSGLAHSADLWKEFQDCQDLMREYFLRLLGYRGAYHPFSEPNDTREL